MESIYYDGNFKEQKHNNTLATFPRLLVTPLINKFPEEIDLQAFVEEGWARYPEL